MISLQATIDKIETFYRSHMQVMKVSNDFRDQMNNFATNNEEYPIVFIVPISVTNTENTNIFTFDIYCFDIIQKDRANITTILSDTHQILMDLFNYFTFSNDRSMDVSGTPSFTALNNDLLDYAAGYVMTIALEVDNWTDCQVPLE